MNRAYRFRIYPNKEQEILLAKTFGCCRFIYNQMLHDKITAYEQEKKMLRTTPAMYKGEFPWLKEVDSLALANVQQHLEKAYKNFFGNPKIGYPRYKSKHSGKRSYTTNLVNGNIVLGDGKIRLPKLGTIRVKQHREIPEEYRMKSVTVSQEPSGEYYVSVLFVCENQAGEQAEVKKALGIDFSMHGLAVFSDGTRAEYPMFYKNAEKKLAREQRFLSRCVRGSSNYRKQKRKVAKCHAKIRNQRRDFQHKLSFQIAESYDAVCVEMLNMKAMSQGLHLGKSVMDNGYGMFQQILEYKLRDRGKQLVHVGQFYPSSKTCSVCGKVKEKLELSERVFICECGNQMDRDINAAVNIRAEGLRFLSESGKCA